MQYVIEENRLFAIAMRRSGEYDFYTDMKFENIKILPEDFELNGLKIGRCYDIGISFFSFYIKFRDYLEQDFFCELKHRGKARVSLSDIKKRSDINTSLAFCAKKRIAPFVYLYNDFEMSTQIGGPTSCFVAHGKFVSKYSLLDQQWNGHIEFTDDVSKIFR